MQLHQPHSQRGPNTSGNCNAKVKDSHRCSSISKTPLTPLTPFQAPLTPLPKTVQVLRFQYLQKEVDLEIERREARKESQQEAKARKLLACKWPWEDQENGGRASPPQTFLA